MSYLVIARKYRPDNFESIEGQEHVTRTLANSIKRDRIAHAYVFAGPRGVGKTSSARVLAKALNCEAGPTSEPCGDCAPCQDITNGRCLAVREIDGASHNSVDNVRDLIDSFRSLPPPGCRYKVYIIDEVHMLSTSAFNALLKSLEEPPPNTVFILATTEIHKIPETVLSRCQRHDFRPMSVATIEKNLRMIAETENIEIEAEVLRMIARGGSGSMRDAQTLLERVRSFCEDKIIVKDAVKVLGAVERSILENLTQAIFTQNVQSVLKISEQIFQSAINPALFLNDFVNFWREALIAKCSGKSALTELGYSEEESNELLGLVADIDSQDILDLVDIARRGAEEALRSSYPQLAFDALVVRMAAREPVRSLANIVSNLKKTAPTTKKSNQVVAVADVKQEVAAPPADTSWASFIEFLLKEKTSPLLIEQLKRCLAVKFEQGILHLRGPEIAINYLSGSDQLDKLKSYLKSYGVNGQDWQVNLDQGTSKGAAEPDSIEDVAKTVAKEKLDAKKKAVNEHPTVQSLKKAFPGSTLEDLN